jgi:hypothetical protein
MTVRIVGLIAVLFAVAGCGAGLTGGGSSEFNTAMKKMRAVTSVGANQQEFRAALQGLAAATDGSERADKIISIYKDSLDLWDLMNNPGTSEFKIAGQSEYRGGLSVPVKNDSLRDNEYWKADKRNAIAAVFEILKRHRDIVKVQDSLTAGELQWVTRPDAVQQLWAKAAKM